MDWAAYLQTAGDVEIQHLTCVQELAAADSNRSLSKLGSWECAVVGQGHIQTKHGDTP